MSIVQDLKVRISADISQFNSSMRSLSDRLDDSRQQFQGLSKTGEALSSVGKKLTTGLTVPIAGIAVASAKASIDIESAFAGVRKTLDTSGLSANEAEKAFKDIENGIMELSKKMPTAATEIAGVAESAGQLGIKRENILGFTEVMVKLGDTTNLSADEASTALARLANITGMPQTQFDRLGSTIVALGNNLATTEAEITEMGLRLAGAGKQVGMSQAQIVSFAGALSSVGINAEAGGSALSKVMIDMQLSVEKGGGRLKQFADVAGMSASQFKKAFKEDASQAILAFIKGLGNAEKQGKSAIGILDDMDIKEVVLRDTLLRTAGASDVLANALEIGNTAWEENTALTNEANQRYETTASKLAIAKNELISAGKAIGDNLIPYIRDIAKWIADLSEKFANLNPNTQKFIMVVAGLLAVLGPILSVVGGVISAFAGLSAIAGALGIGLGVLVGKILLVTGIIGAVIAICYLLVDNWDWLCEQAKKIGEAIGEAWNSILKKTEELAQKMGDGWNSMVQTTIEKWDEMWANISEWWNNLMTSIGEWFTGVVQWFTDGWNQCVEATTEAWNSFTEVISSVWDTICNLVQVGLMLVVEVIKAGVLLIMTPWLILWENCKGFIIPIWEGICSYIGEKLEQIKSWVSEKLEYVKQTFDEKWQALRAKTYEIYDAIANAISEKLEKIKAWVSEKLEYVSKTFDEKWQALRAKTYEIYDLIVGYISEKLEQMKKFVSEKLEIVVGYFRDKWEQARNYVYDKVTAIVSFLSEKLEIAKSYVSEKLDAIKNYFSEKFELAKAKVSEKMEQIKQAIKEKIDTAKNATSTAVDGIKSKFDIFGTIASNVSTKFESIKKTISDKMTSAKDTVKRIIDTIKGLFKFNLSFPKIKVPVFGFTGKFSVNPPSVPHFGIKSWKWLNKGAIFKKKTVLPSGYGVGDASFGGVGNNAEAVLPINKLPELLGLDKEGSKGGITLNIERFENNREQDVEQLATELAFYLKRKKLIGGA